MKKIFAGAIAVLAFTSPVAAEEAQEGGLSMMERGALLFMQGMMREMEPAIEEFSDLAEELAPAMRQFSDQINSHLGSLLENVEDWRAYEAPEFLPNGDIIIRRKQDRSLPDEGLSEDGTPQIDI
ncbi:MAG: hypothetical protein AAF755_12850 [Pseudomonadota bacterium]